MLVDDAIEKVAYVAGVDGDDVIDYVEKLAYENDLDEIEVLAELEKEAKLKMPAFAGKARQFVSDKTEKPRNWVSDKTERPRNWVGDKTERPLAWAKAHPKTSKGIAIGAGSAAGLGAAAYGYNKYKNKKACQEEASLSDVV